MILCAEESFERMKFLRGKLVPEEGVEPTLTVK